MVPQPKPERKYAMQDRNGKEIDSGMVIEICNAWSRSDNGRFLVDHTYSDGGFWMRKLGAKGQLLKAAGRSWPLKCYSSNQELRRKIDAHNEANATVEVIGDTWTAPETKPMSNEIRLTMNGIHKGEHYAPLRLPLRRENRGSYDLREKVWMFGNPPRNGTCSK